MSEAATELSETRRTWKERLAIPAAVLAAAFLLLVVFLPTLLSTGPGTRLAVGIANRSISGEWSVDDLSVGWFSSTRLVRLGLNDPEGKPVARMGELTMHDLSLLDLLFSGRELGRISGRELTLEMVRYEDGSTNLTRALQSPDGRSEKPGQDSRIDEAEPTKLSLDLQFEDMRMTMSAPDMEPVQIEAPKVSLKTEGLDQTAVDLEAVVKQGALIGKITASGGVSQPADASPRADLIAEVESVPVAAIDQLAGYGGKFVALLGDRADGELRFVGALDDADLELSAHTPNLDVQLPLHLSAEAIQNRGEARIRLAMGPEAYAAWFGPSGGGKLVQPVTLGMSLNELDLPLANGEPLVRKARAALDLVSDAMKFRIAGLGDVELKRLDGRAALDPDSDSASLELTGPFTISGQSGELKLEAVVAGLNSDEGYEIGVTLTDLPVPVLDQLANQNGRALALLGNKLTLDAEGKYPGEMTVEARSDTLRLQAPLTLTEQSCSLSGAEVSLMVRPAGYLALAGEQGGTLAQPVTVNASISEMLLPLKQGAPDFAKLRGVAKLEATTLDLGLPDMGRLLLQHLQGTLKTNREDDSAQLELASPLTFNGEPGRFEARLTISDLTSDQWLIEASLADLPVSLADRLAGQDGWLVVLIGDKAALDVKGRYPGDLDLTVQGSDSRIEAPLEVGAESWSLRSPGQAQFELDPVEYKALLGANMGQLTRPVSLTFDLEQGSVPLLEGKPDWSRLKAALNGRSGVVEVDVPQLGPVKLESLACSFKSDPSDGDAKLSIKSPIEAAGQTGDLDAVITLRDATQGTLYDIEGAFSNLPVPLVDGFLGLNGLITALAGPTATLNVKGQYPGALSLNLRSRSARAEAPLSIDQEKTIVTLTDDVAAEIQLEEESAREVLGKMHPILADVVASEKAIQLNIQRQGFQLPFQEFALEKVLAQGVLELGTLRMSRRGWMQLMQDGMTGLLGGTRASEGTQYLAQFTPAKFVIADGRVRTEEMWMTADTLAVGFAGGADVSNNRYDFTMGMLGASLIAMAPQLKSVVQATQVLEVPLRGSLNQPAPDWKPLITRLATQMAASQLGGGGQLGQILGGLGSLFEKRRNRGGGGFVNQLRWSPPPAALKIARSIESSQSESRPR